jgi:hypothetical protein
MTTPAPSPHGRFPAGDRAVRVLLGALAVALGVLLLDAVAGDALVPVQTLVRGGLAGFGFDLAGISAVLLPSLLLAWHLLGPAPAAPPVPVHTWSPDAPRLCVARSLPHRQHALTATSVLALRQ